MSYTAPGSFTGDPAKGSLAEYSVVYTDRAINLMAAPFGQVMRDISSNLKHVYSAQHVAVIPGSGSYGMEAVARQFGWKKEVLVIRNGYFSYRWSDIFHVCDIPKADGETVLKAGVVADAGTAKQPQFGPQSLDDVLAAISEKQPAAVFAPHVETSTGIILSDAYLTAVASAVHAYGGVFVVDSIASGNIWVDMAATGVDVLISAPQKGWSGPACCGLVMLSDHGRHVSDATASSSFCCNLGKWLTVMDKYESGGFMYYTTLPTDSLTAFRDVMLEARAYGYDKCKERQLELGAKVRAALEARGYRSVAAEGFKAPGVVVSYVQSPAQQSRMVGAFKAAGIQIAGGVPFKLDETIDARAVTFRLGLFGIDKLLDVDMCVAKLEAALDSSTVILGNQQPFGEDELFMGSKRVHLSAVPGRVVNYIHADYAPGMDDASLARTLSRKEPIPHPDGGRPVIVPCMPCLDQVVASGAAPSSDVSAWPEFLRTPLMKVPDADASPDEPLAFASGTRSCTVKLGDSWYRLKGSGNHDQGFIVREDSTKAHGEWRDIRGAAFEHTAICENYMGSRLAARMAPLGIPGANDAMGYYIYAAPNLPLGPAFEPACIVEKTLGDRRFGTHVLAGIELLLDRLIDADAIDAEKLLTLFPAARPRVVPAFDAPYGVTMTSTLMCDHCLAVMYKTGTNGLSYDIPRDETVFSCALGCEDFPETAPDAGILPRQYYRDTGEGAGVKDADPRWGEAWAQACGELDAALTKCRTEGRGSLLAYLFSRLGYECGRFARELHKGCRVSWGTYADAMCQAGQLHCNAHNNNVVVIKPGLGPPDSYLAYLDLDMAFDDTTFVDTWKTGKVGAVPAEFDELLVQENVNFMEVIAGSDTTSGVPAVAKHVVEAFPDSLKLAKVALYDTMLTAYVNAYTGNANCKVAPFDEAMHAGGYAVIKLAIICQAEYVA